MRTLFIFLSAFIFIPLIHSQESVNQILKDQLDPIFELDQNNQTEITRIFSDDHYQDSILQAFQQMKLLGM
jgi:hypothetical protein